MRSVWLFLHLVGASVWLGGMITMGATVPALRRSKADPETIRAAARAFGRLSWLALGLAIAAGLGLVGGDVTAVFSGRMLPKSVFVAVAAGLALWHQRSAAHTSPRRRGIVQGLILLATLGIFATAVRL